MHYWIHAWFSTGDNDRLMARLDQKGDLTMRDFFRPTSEPAKMLYDAFQEEAKKRHLARSGRCDEQSVHEWMDLERQAVWSAARDYSQQHGFRVLKLDEIQAAEEYASGHVDYGAKWAYAVARRITKK